MKHGILITHGPIGDAIIQASRTILGIDDGLHALDVTEMSVDEITQRLKSIVNSPERREQGVIIMASLLGGSCWNVSAAVAKEMKNIEVVSGVNLPMVLSFMTKRDKMPLKELAQVLVNDGHRSVTKLI
ncbi:PTS sugar transporter subunit IIA [candidate division KSB1 bacterium]|nr:PTS sugar transporter subunit IIA [candidate division KSB1 bacterium]